MYIRRRVCKILMSMINRIFFFFAVFFFAYAGVIHAQSQNDEYQLKVTLKDAETGAAIPFAHIFNIDKGRGVLSDSSGTFSVLVQEGDSLRLSSVSYGQQILIAPPRPQEESFLLVKLAPNVYELQEVVINRFPSEREFRRKLLTADIPKEEVVNMQFQESLRVVPANPDGNAHIGMGSPVSAIASKFSKKERGRVFAAEMKTQDERKAIIHSKYNREIVQKITGLEDDGKLDSFMKYCVLEEDFLFSANEYEIHKAVLGCFGDFMQEQEG